GFRENNDQDQDIYNVFAQMSLTPKASILSEFRTTHNENGDLSLRFDPDNFSPFFRQNVDAHLFRIGTRYAFTPQNNLIATFAYSKLNGDTREAVPEFDIEFEQKDEDDGYMFEVQHLLRSEKVNLIIGIGHFQSDRKSTQVIIPEPPEVDKVNIEHTNPYVYSQFNILDNLLGTIGASIDFFDGKFADRNQFNPKFGLTWNILPETTLRVAVFRVLKRTLISNQTIEPTQVAGFNQFFDDGNGTDAWRYGAAIDHELNKNLYSGLEFSKRDLNIPYEDLTFQIEEVAWEEYFGRAYIFLTPHRWISASLEYQYERMERDSEFVGFESIKTLNTHKIPFGFNFFHPSGISMGFKIAYIDQNGEFGDPRFGAVEDDSDQFWLVDAVISYRLPKRYGIITVEAKNLLDEEFRFQDIDPSSPEIPPERLILGKITISF
ncbi:MAG: TonB-dependent receptor, partial [Cyclobacteriaceae bacterium]|nr:TonB-dependent receptor [Cyclobacteriaceae bacterium]